MMKLKTLLFTVLGLSLAVVASAQTTTTQTTSSAAINATQLTLSLASGTNVAAGSELFIDNEDFIVTGGTSTAPTVLRGQNGTGVWPHVSGAIVWVAAPLTLAAPQGPFIDADPSGSCTASALPFTVLINRRNGLLWACNSGLYSSYNWVPGDQGFNRTAVAGGSYTAALTDYLIAYTTLSGWSTLTLPTPSGGLAGHVIIVKDELKKLSPWSVTLSVVGSIDGLQNLILTQDNVTTSKAPFVTNGVFRFYSDGLQWFSW